MDAQPETTLAPEESADSRPFVRRAPRSVVAFACWFAIGVGVAYIAYLVFLQIRVVLYLIAFSLIIGLTLDPLIKMLQHRGLTRTSAALITWLFAAAVLSAPVVLAIDTATTQLPSLIRSVPELIRNAEDHLGPLGDRLRAATSDSGNATIDPAKIVNYFLRGSEFLLNALTYVVIVAFLSLYFAIGLPRLRTLSLMAFPASRQEKAARIVDELTVQVGRVMLATLVIAILCGLGTTIWCLSWGIPYAVVLGTLVVVLSLVPVIGSTVGGALVTLVSLTVNLPTAIATLIFYVGYRLAEDYLIQPRIMRFSVELPGVITVPAVLLGGAILGIPGAFFAVPIAIVLRTLVREIAIPAVDRL